MRHTKKTPARVVFVRILVLAFMAAVVGTAVVPKLSYAENDSAVELVENSEGDAYSHAGSPDSTASVIILVAVGVTGLVAFLSVRNSRRLQQQVANEKSALEELQKKNLELQQSQDALSEALIANDHVNRANSVFLSNMSHDIRTPMNAIVGFTALATSHIDNKDQVLEYLGKISLSSQQLLMLLNDVLDMSRIESGTVTITESGTHLPDIINDITAIVLPETVSKHQEFLIEATDVVHEDIVTDGRRLHQILRSMLSNATKFTPEGGSISLHIAEKATATPEKTCFEFRVRDNGIGMSKDFQKSIFDPFTREQTSTESGVQGAGLGMAIAKNIVDLMGGTIEVSSTLGVGTEFTVTLPCKVSSESVVYEPLPEMEGVRALVANDDVRACLSVCAMLSGIGMSPDWAVSGKDVLSAARDAKESDRAFGVYVIDNEMPDLNGVEMIQEIRRVTGDDGSTIILSSYDWKGLVDEAAKAGATAFCSKPIFMSELYGILQHPLASGESAQKSWEKFDFTGIRILLAEDNELNQEIAVAILEDAGVTVDVVNDGVGAVDAMALSPAGTYDLVLMDIQMPRMDGYEATRRIRALEDSAKAGIPIVALTANVFEEDRQTAYEVGMNDHISKPYQVSDILATVARLVG